MIKRLSLVLAAIGPATFLLSACAGLGSDGRTYPSLAKRTVELRGLEEADAAPDTASVSEAGETQEADAALKQQLADLLGKAQQGKTKFDRLYQEVAGPIRVTRSAAVSSEAWVAAQMNLSRLEQARYDSVYALASLDTLYAGRMQAVETGMASGGIADIDRARKQALAIVDDQNDQVDGLKAALKKP
ncbi:MAG: hypothetical protein E2598_04265 [Sphingobium sp.]|nr:hypothetical protein [Sphingobium sp.]